MTSSPGTRQLSRDGFGPPNRRTQAHDEDRGAVVLTTDDYETIFLADMSGDGLSDLVRIRNGDVCYWPNLGYGRFGAKIAMKSAPQFDTPDLFDPRRIRLGDIDGTGVTDIVYLSRRGADVYLNQAGNGLDAGHSDPVAAGRRDGVGPRGGLSRNRHGVPGLVERPTPRTRGPRCATSICCTARSRTFSVPSSMALVRRPTITYAPSTQFYLRIALQADPGRCACRLLCRLSHKSRRRMRWPGRTSSFAIDTRMAGSTASSANSGALPGLTPGTPSRCRRTMALGRPPGGLAEQNGEYDLPPVHTISWFHTGAWNGQADDLRASAEPRVLFRGYGR